MFVCVHYCSFEKVINGFCYFVLDLVHVARAHILKFVAIRVVVQLLTSTFCALILFSFYDYFDFERTFTRKSFKCF